MSKDMVLVYSRKTCTGLVPVGFLAFLMVLTVGCSERSTVPGAEQRVYDLNKVIMCPVCPGESIDQSQHPLSIQMRGIVERKFEEGWSEAQIKSYFVESYGPRVLLEPPSSGINLMVWVVPPVVVVGVGMLLMLVLKSMVRTTRTHHVRRLEVASLTAEERKEYFRRIESFISEEPDKEAGV